MYEEKDYILRVIHEAIRMLFRLILNIDIDREEEFEFEREEQENYKRLLRMIDDGDINEAENQLVSSADAADLQDFKLAMLFYEHLNRKDDAFLKAHDFSREEILDGVKYMISFYGYGSMLEAFMEDFA